MKQVIFIILIMSSATIYGQDYKKDSLLNEVSQYEKNVNKAAALFLNKELSADERINAIEPYAIIYDENQVEQFKNVILDDKEQPEIRAAALSKIYQFVLNDERLGTLAIEWLGDPQAPKVLRQMALQLAALYKVLQQTKNETTRLQAIRALGFYKEAREKLVTIGGDANEKEQFREAALDALDADDKAVIPTCPNTPLPVIEVQINNTPSNHDDYGSVAAYTTCKARIVNYLISSGGDNFPKGVPVVIRNPADRSNSAFSLSFSSTGGTAAGEARIFPTLPGNGNWITFYVKGTTTSTVDKSSIIEIAAQGTCSSDAVLARKALMIQPTGSTAPIPADRPQVVIEIGSVSTLDDYLTWAPKPCRIMWSNPPPQVDITYQNPLASGSFVVSQASFTEPAPAGSTLTITLRNMNNTGTNKHLKFAGSTLAAGQTATRDSLSLTLNGDGSWANFYMAGNYPNASVRDKDAVMEVRDASTGLLLSREGVMVRIRKNANTLTPAERDRFLNALNKLNSSSKFNDYIDFVKTHSRDNINDVTKSMISHRQAHSGSAFLPWHRAFVLHFERLLQAADPSVALPYWKFDAPAPNIFTQNFMGSDGGNNRAILASNNPIRLWSMSGDGVQGTGITRGTMKVNSTKNGVPAGMPTEQEALALGSSFSAFKNMETSFHNLAHSAWPAPSWILLPELAPRDPLFFSLHCNVDHVWAKWQWLRDRYTATSTLSYDLQGSYASPPTNLGHAYVTDGSKIVTNRTLGQYAGDTMWPWDNVTGGSGTAARPGIAVLSRLPVTLGTTLPDKPTVKSVIDYLNITAPVPGEGLGYAYDDFFPYD